MDLEFIGEGSARGAVCPIGLLASPFAGASESFTQGRQVAPMPKQFKAGDYVWYPQISPAGPVVIVVSIPEQQLFVFRNGVRIGRICGRCSVHPGMAVAAELAD
jgi:hypothetical protein